MINYEETGKKIAKFRTEKGLTQAVLAELIDLSPQYISFIERGRRKASLETVVKIAVVLKVSLDQLVFFQGKKKDQAELNNLFDDCSDAEKEIILNVLLALKRELRKSIMK